MTTTFASPTEALFDLVLGHLIDIPVGIDEFMNYIIDIGDPIDPRHFPCPPGYIRSPSGQCIPPPRGPTECDALCGITDAFTRTTPTSSMGTADCGLDYVSTLLGDVTIHCDGTSAIATMQFAGGGNPSISNALAPPSPDWDSTVVHSIQFSMGDFGDPAIDFAEKLEFSLFIGGKRTNGVTFSETLRVVIIPSNSSLWLQGAGATPSASAYSQVTWTSDVISGTQIPISYWVANTVYTVSIYESAGVLVGSISNGTTTYSTSLGGVARATLSAIGYALNRRLVAPYTTALVNTTTIDNLDFPEATRCTAIQFDDFNRTVAANSFGTATNGTAWTTGGGTVSASVNGSAALFTTSTFDVSRAMRWNNSQAVAPPWMTDGSTPNDTTMTMHFSFNFAVPGAGAGYVELVVFPDVSPAPTIRVSSTQGRYGFSSNLQSKTSWTSGRLYIAQWTYVAATGVSTFIVSDEGFSPGSASTASPNISTTKKLLVNYYNGTLSGTARPWQIDYIDFDYPDRPCYLGQPPVPLPPPVGYVCETLIHGGGLIFHTTKAFQTMSLEVWINGLAATPSSTDGPYGLFTFSAGISSSDILHVCYFANGEPLL